MRDLTVVIPARNEMFLNLTIQDILAKMRVDTEIIVILDGQWPTEPIPDHPRVHLVYHAVSIGQRAATNEGVRLSEAEYVMKLDAHCMVGEGFDQILIESAKQLGPDVTQIPAQYNLHAFNWKCPECGVVTYQSPTPVECRQCKTKTPAVREIVWQPRWSRRTEFWYFDHDLHFQYWRPYKHREEAKGDVVDVMSSLGACVFMRRDRFLALGGMDEAHGSWGQFGTEIACKSWLSGGRQVVNKKTWFCHLFRTQGGDFGFPYELSGKQISRARARSRELWLDGKWEGTVRPLKWLVRKFAPVPTWPDEPLTAGVVYYSDCRGDPRILEACRRQLWKASAGLPGVAVTLQPVEVPEGWRNIVLPLERGRLTMFRQILAGITAMETDIIFLAEHDILYHPSHFAFRPADPAVYYYNEHTWKVDAATGRALFYYCKQTSGLCAWRIRLLDHYQRRVAEVEANGYRHSLGYEPGCHKRPRGLDDFPAERWMSEVPNVDIRHGCNLTANRWSQDQFRDKSTCQGWTEADEVPGWGVTKGRFDAFLDEVSNGRAV